MVRSASRNSILICSLLSAASLAENNDKTDFFRLNLEELAQIKLTSVFRYPEKLSTSPSSIQVITNNQIRQSGATNIAESLRLASNLNVAQQNSHEWIVSARGFSSDVGNKLLVMMDGRNVYTPLFSGVFWSRQDYLLEDLDRIEVISGPGGSLWGANAVNGVVNIISKHSSESQGWYFEGATGEPLESLAGIRYGGRYSSTSAYRVYGKYSERDSEYLSDGSDGFDAWSMGQAGFRWDTELLSSATLTIQGDIYQNETGENTAAPTSSKGGNLLARWKKQLSEASDYELQVYFDQTDLEMPVLETIVNDIVFAPEGMFYDVLDTVDIDFTHRIKLSDRHTLLWGVNYRYTHDKVTNAPGLGFFPQDLEQDLTSAFIQDEITISNNVSVTLGTKVENNDYTGIEWEPSIRAAWEISQNHMLWSAISKAVRMPSRIDTDFSQPVPPYLVILRGDEDFESEEVTAYELGFRSYFTDRAILSVASFYNKYADLRSTSFTDATIIPFYFENNLQGDSYGMELNVNYQVENWWMLRLGYNYLKHELEVKEGESDFNNTLNETADPEHQFHAQLTMDIKSNIEFMALCRWVDDLTVNNAGLPATMPSYTELDLRLGWKMNDNIELSLVGRNLLDQHHQEFGIPFPIQEEVGRTVFVKIVWRQ